MKLLSALLFVALLPLQAYAQEPARPAAAPAAAAAKSADPRVELAARLPGASPDDLRATPVPGIYEYAHGASISYISADAKYVFNGDLFRVTGNGEFPNLSEPRRQELRAKIINDVPESEMVIFGPKVAKYTITVFTDVDCPWCRRLHSDVAQYTKAGIRVRYLAWPRSGPATEGWVRAQAVWCSANRNEAFTRAAKGEALKPVTCAQDPVKRHYELGQQIGVRGTPVLVMPDGEMFPGYLQFPQLLAYLQGQSAPK
jgi:thiol:disulfide interchange protein DsbC